MGLERMTAVLQGTHDNYEIDLFKKLIDASAEITKSPVSNKMTASHRAISDHLRAVCFLIVRWSDAFKRRQRICFEKTMRRE